MRANGRKIIIVEGEIYMPERATAHTLGISRMTLRRTPALRASLMMLTRDGHPYYMAKLVEKASQTLSGYVLRGSLTNKPKLIMDRVKKGETVVFGLKAYPKEMKQ